MNEVTEVKGSKFNRLPLCRLNRHTCKVLSGMKPSNESSTVQGTITVKLCTHIYVHVRICVYSIYVHSVEFNIKTTSAIRPTR